MTTLIYGWGKSLVKTKGLTEEGFIAAKGELKETPRKFIIRTTEGVSVFNKDQAQILEQ